MAVRIRLRYALPTKIEENGSFHDRFMTRSDAGVCIQGKADEPRGSPGLQIFGAVVCTILVTAGVRAVVLWLRTRNMATHHRPLIVRRKISLSQIFIDANCINALQRNDDLNQLESWDRRGVISLRLPEQAQLEVEAAGDRQRRKTMNRLVPQAYITTDEEKRALKTIEDVISPKKPLSKNDAADAMNVFIAWKYSAILVTLDRALLRKAEALQSAIGAQVMHPRDVVEVVRRKIQSRDRAAKNVARRGFPLEPWVGQDDY